MVEVTDNLGAPRMDGRPVRVEGKGEAIEKGGTVPGSVMMVCLVEGDQHITGNSGISVDPPRPAYAGLSVKHAELIKAEFVLQATGHGYAGFASADDDNGIIRVGIFVISIDSPNGIREMGHEY